MCDEITNISYLNKFIDQWRQSNGTNNQIGYNCVTGPETNPEINLLDFIALISNMGNPVSDWCNTCITVQQTTTNYLVLDYEGKRRPLYYYKNDAPAFGDPTNTDPNWKLVEVPTNQIKQHDPNNNPTTQFTTRTLELQSNKYLLHVVAPNCNNLPLPVYTFNGDTNELPTGISTTWPLVSRDGTPVLSVGGPPYQIPDCPSCDGNWGE